jgi:TonB family protein
MQKNSLFFLCLSANAVFAQSDVKITERPIESSKDEPVMPQEPIEQTPAFVSIVEQHPQFPGGGKALVAYIQENVVYPKEAIANGIEGKVYIQFLVRKTGKIDNIKILRGLLGGCNEEAIRLVRAMPQWMPATNNGRPVDVYYTLPITFSAR